KKRRLTKYDIRVFPAAESAKIDGLSLKIPLKAQYAKLFHVLGPNSGLRNPYVTGVLRPGNGRVWDSQNDAPFLPRYTVGNFVSMMWLGGMVRGLVWYADNDRGWVPNDEKPAVTVTRDGDTVTLEFHFISEPFTLREPRHISYTLMGTPPKPLPKDYRLWNRGHLDTAGKVAGRLTSCDSFAPWVVPCRASTFAYWPPEDDWDLVKMAVERQRHTSHSKYPPGQALMLYHDKNKCPAHPRMLPHYGWSWGRCRYPTARINHLIYYMDKMIKYGYDGLYIDDVFPFGDWNLEPVGTSYLLPRKDKPAKKQVGSAYGEYRTYLKRLYSVFHSHGKRPIITTHMTSTLGWPFHSFVTVAFDCEQSARFREDNTTFIDAWPLDYLMTLDIPERSGIVTVPMLKSDYLEGRTPSQTWAAERSFKAIWMLFDHNHKLKNTILQPYYGTDVAVFPFWRNQEIIQITPIIKGKVKERDLPKPIWWKSEHFRKSLARRPLRASAYVKDNRCLLIVTNFLRRSVGARLDFNREKLGIPPAEKASLRARNVDGCNPPEGVDLATMHLAELVKTKIKGPTVDEAMGGAGDTGEETIEGMLGEQVGDAAGPDKRNREFRNITLEGNTLELNVPPHNFRAIELTWEK
ncbi:MAG: hypothetical protein KGZ25_09440, partial [Planctomycetes bacterium]|nr:hypothetical protein [Planctomycetota bacterium]